jgi:hypothetical protein
MHTRMSRYAAIFLVLASSASIACSDDSETAAASITGPSAFALGSASASLTAEPAIIAAEFQQSAACRAQPPFDARLAVTIRPTQDLFVRGFGFEFLDQFDRRVLPLVFPGTIEVNNAVLPSIPLPTTHPIPFPGQVPMSSAFLDAGRFFRFPFRLQFNCGVPARGTLFVSVETADRRGMVDVSRIRAQIQ